MRAIQRINAEIITELKGRFLLVNAALYQKKSQLLYLDKEPQRFCPNDEYNLVLGHIRTGGRQDTSIVTYNSWKHDFEVIGIGSHSYLEGVITGIENGGGVISGYDLKGWNIWKQYFGMEEYPENQLFVIKYHIKGNISDVTEVCGSDFITCYDNLEVC